MADPFFVWQESLSISTYDPIIVPFNRVIFSQCNPEGGPIGIEFDAPEANEQILIYSIAWWNVTGPCFVVVDVPGYGDIFRGRAPGGEGGACFNPLGIPMGHGCSVILAGNTMGGQIEVEIMRVEGFRREGGFPVSGIRL